MRPTDGRSDATLWQEGDWLSREDLTLEELVEQAGAMLPAVAPRQTRYKVTERPDARTIRYYVTQGLLPRPVSHEGGRARYTGRHLLRLLAVKRLQAEHHTLRRIARILAGASDEELVRQLGISLQPATPPPEQPKRTSPSRDGATATPATAAASRRLELAPGGCVDVPIDVLRDPAARRRLAQGLRDLACWLEDTTHDDPTPNEPDPSE